MLVIRARSTVDAEAAWQKQRQLRDIYSSLQPYARDRHVELAKEVKFMTKSVPNIRPPINKFDGGSA